MLDQDLSLAYTHPGIAPPADICAHLLVIYGRLNLNDLIAAASESMQTRFSVFVRTFCANRACDASSAPLADVMCELGRYKDLVWLYRGLIFSLAMFVEASMKSSGLDTCPIGYQTAVGRRMDRTLADHLVMGKGVDQSATPVVFVETHTRSYLALCRASKLLPPSARPKAMNVNHVREHQMMRYLWLAKQFFLKCQRFTIALDGTRVCRYEYNLVVVIGTDDSGASLSVRCPPQALLYCRGRMGGVESQFR